MSKILIYSHADSQNIIDDYVLYALKILKNEGFSVVFCTKSNLPPTEKCKIAQLLDQILVMPADAMELDVWKKALLTFRDKLTDCEQLLLLNDTCYGPIFPLSTLFEKMRSSQTDFWVLTERYSPSEVPDSLASSFLYFSYGTIHSELFWNFWNNLPDGSNTNQLSLPEMMSQSGFSFARAIDIQDQRQAPYYHCQEPFSHNITDFLIRHCHLPFIPIKSFCNDYTKPFDIGGLVMRAMEQSGSPYPQEIIYRHLHRLFPLSSQKTLPGNTQVFQRNTTGCQLISPLKIAVICHIFSVTDLADFLSYLHNMPQKFDLLVTTVSEENKAVILSFLQNFDEVEKVFVRVVPNHGRDIYPWLTAFRDIHDNYDLCLKIHLKISSQLPQSLSSSWQLFLMDSFSPQRTTPFRLSIISYPSQLLESCFRIFHP